MESKIEKLVTDYVNKVWKDNDDNLGFRIGDDNKIEKTERLEFTKKELLKYSILLIDHLNTQPQTEREDSKVGFLNEAILSCTEEDIEKWNKNEIKKRDILARDVLDNGFDTTYTTATAKQMEVETDILLRKRFLMEVISSLESTLRSIKCGEDCGLERTIIELLEDMGYGNLYSMLPKRLKILSSEDWANFNKNIDNITV